MIHPPLLPARYKPRAVRQFLNPPEPNSAPQDVIGGFIMDIIQLHQTIHFFERTKQNNEDPPDAVWLVVTGANVKLTVAFLVQEAGKGMAYLPDTLLVEFEFRA